MNSAHAVAIKNSKPIDDRDEETTQDLMKKKLYDSNMNRMSTIMSTLRRFSTLMLCALCLGVIATTLPMEAQIHGKDGAKTVTSNEIVNIYTRMTASAAVGDTSLTVNSSAGFSSGDLIFIYQAQGASIATSPDNASYGAVTNYNGAGMYEVVGVAAVYSSNTISLVNGISYAYSIAGNTQVVRVPQYTSLTINASGVLTGQAWNGETGGIVAVHASGTVSVNGNIDADGIGFRGGALTTNGASTSDYTTYRTSSTVESASKGESIAGHPATLTNGANGRGAPANGGGGGNTHNAGGGGGANGNSGDSWTGAGVMCTACTGSAAWALDPAYIANGNTYTTSSGGGRGGYTYAHSDGNAFVHEPGNSAWTGSYRRERGGLGGRPLSNNTCSRVFFGGGGGAGNQNNNAGSAGANGGGLIFLLANTVDGSGTISANGASAANTRNGHNDGPGGGGGGGTVLISATNAIGGISIYAEGGNGGSQLITNSESEGPGGGGGGGVIATSTTSVTRSVAGGSSGTSSSNAVTEFPTNGGTNGAAGEIHTDLCAFPLPVELTSFSGRKVGSAVQLRWSTATESNNFGFDIERRTENSDWESIGFESGAGTTNAPRSYTYRDTEIRDLRHADMVIYRLKQIDRDGTFEYTSTVEIPLSTTASDMELLFSPNPVRSQATIRIYLAKEDHVTLRVYNSLGSEVATVMQDSYLQAGSHSVPLDASSFAAGSYIVTMEGEGGFITQTLTKTR